MRVTFNGLGLKATGAFGCLFAVLYIALCYVCLDYCIVSIFGIHAYWWATLFGALALSYISIVAAALLWAAHFYTHFPLVH